jgi:hypothetical protein
MLGFIVAAAAVAGGCASSKVRSPQFDVAAGKYADAFEASRDVLAAGRFELDRVDGAAGVISTLPKPTSGLATPWDDEQSSFRQEIEDAGNRQQRRVRITFEPASGAPATGDLRELSAPLVGRVEVTVDRVRRTEWRLETTAIRFSSFAADPALQARGMYPQFIVAVSQDPELAGRIAEQINKKLAETSR